MKVYLSHSKKMDYINELYNPIKEAFFLKEEFYFPHEKSAEILNGFDYYKQFDVVVAEVSHTGTGIGIELGFAYALNIPIICFYKKGTKYANSLNSVTDKFFEYDSIDDFLFKLYIVIEKRYHLTIMGLYHMLGIPEHLGKHMLDTAAVCYLIASNIVTSKYNLMNIENIFGKVVTSFDRIKYLNEESTLVKEMLLHDVGNLIKLQPYEIETDLTRWIRDYLDKKSNGDEHLATDFICKLFYFTDEQIERLNLKNLENCVNVANSNDICVKIEAYADQRVSSNGVVSLEEGLKELKNIHSKDPKATLYGKKVDKIIEAAFKNEEQIFEVCKLTKEDINKETIEQISKELETFGIWEN